MIVTIVLKRRTVIKLKYLVEYVKGEGHAEYVKSKNAGCGLMREVWLSMSDVRRRVMCSN